MLIFFLYHCCPFYIDHLSHICTSSGYLPPIYSKEKFKEAVTLMPVHNCQAENLYYRVILKENIASVVSGMKHLH